MGETNLDVILSGLPRVPQFGDELVASATSLHLGGAPAHSKYAPRRGNT